MNKKDKFLAVLVTMFFVALGYFSNYFYSDEGLSNVILMQIVMAISFFFGAHAVQGKMDFDFSVKIRVFLFKIDTYVFWIGLSCGILLFTGPTENGFLQIMCAFPLILLCGIGTICIRQIQR